MLRVGRCFKHVIDTSKCISKAKLLTTCTKRSGAFTLVHAPHSPGKYFSPTRLFLVALQCSKLSQDSRMTRIRKTLPDEIWSIIIVGLGGILVFTYTQYEKVFYGKRSPPSLQNKLKMAKKKALDGDKTQSVILLKEALDLIHDYLKEIRQDSNEELDLDDKDTIKVQKYLAYVLDQLANLTFELQRWKEAENYFRLLLRDLFSQETPKDDDSVIEVSLKLAIACAHQDKHTLATQGFQWATSTIQKKVDESPAVTDNSDTAELFTKIIIENKGNDHQYVGSFNFKALLGVCLEGWGTYLLAQNKPAQAAQLLARALNISKEVLGEDHEQTTVILNNLAKAYAESGDYEYAEELAREAIRIAEKTQSTHLSRFMANLGTILNLEGNVSKAKEALNSALKLANEAKDEETKEMIHNSLTDMDTNPS